MMPAPLAPNRDAQRVSPTPLWWHVHERLFEPVPIAPLVQFRLALGAVLTWEAYRYIASGWPRELFLQPAMLFKYYGFNWVRPLPEPVHIALFPLLGVTAVCVAVGLLYRVASVLLFLGWAYVFLLDQANYLNHMYLITVVAGLMTLLPANRAYSLDSSLGLVRRSEVVPRWTVGLLRALVGLVYFFGGVAKLNFDWLSGVPMQLMLIDRPDLFGQYAGEPSVALFFAYGGLLLDLFIVPLLCWRKTRVFALLLAAGFHLTNHVVFRIGIFPWLMMAATLILWPPFPLRIVSFLRIYGVLVLAGIAAMVRWPAEGREIPAWAWTSVPTLGALWTIDFWLPEWRQFDLEPAPNLRESSTDGLRGRARPVMLTLLGVFFAWQLFMPFRHFLYGGDVAWHEQGHKWSWHMKLRIKQPASAAFFVLDGDSRTVGDYRLLPDKWGYRNVMPVLDPVGIDVPLHPKQAVTMTTRPELILQFAHFLRDRYEGHVKGPVQVRANVFVSLNGRPPANLIDPEANLAAVEDRVWPPAEWVLPLEEKRPVLQRLEFRPSSPEEGRTDDSSGVE